MRQKKTIFPYILLNILISASTTLLVLMIWNGFNRPAAPNSASDPAISLPIPSETVLPDCPASSLELPSVDQEVIRVQNVFGNGDVQNEVVELKRSGDGDLCMTGWVLKDEDGNSFTFPNFVLNKNGEVQINSRVGQNETGNFFWGLDQPVWQSGEKITLLDTLGNIRASYVIQ